MSKRIGVMLELTWPYRRHLDVFAGIQRYAQDAGWQCELDEFIFSELGPNDGLMGRFDGIIARADAQLAKHSAAAEVPLVNVWFTSPVRDDLPGVFPEFAEVGRLAAEHLIDRGYRRFGCLGVSRELAHQVMSGAFHQVLESHECTCQCAHVARRFYQSAGAWSRFQAALDEWIDSWTLPIALFVAFNDVTSRYVVNACRRKGLRVPEDVAIITLSNEPLISTMPPPSLSSIEVNYEQIGYQSAKLLTRLMDGAAPSPHHKFLKPTGIIARDSTDFFAVEDDVVAAAMRFIETRVGQRLDVDDVATAACVSRRTLERRFRAAAGRSVAAEIRRLRTLKAQRLLAETDLLVKQVAEEAGFRNAIRMHEVFIRDVGMSPSEYRQTATGGTARRGRG